MDARLTDRLSRGLVLVAFALAGLAAIAAPLRALSWSSHPFPGFVVEQTLVIATYKGDTWQGRLNGLNHPQRVTHLDGVPVSGIKMFRTLVDLLPPGKEIQVRTLSPDGEERTYLTTILDRFPARDLARLFWLPYGIGLAYLGISIFVYRLRGPTRSCRAFALLSASTALINIFFFDLISTQRGTLVWTLAVAVLGSALIRLALLFPTEWTFVLDRPWLRLAPYAVTIVLGVWGASELYNQKTPWVYIRAWQASYMYAAIGIAFFLVTLMLRLRFTPSRRVKHQAQIILAGSFIAFIPHAVWFLAPVFGDWIEYNPLIFMPVLLLFPLSIAIAILRYHLWNIEIIIHRTLTYSILSLLLALVYFSSVIAFELIIGARIPNSLMGLFSPSSAGGGESQTALMTTVSTLIIAALFTPLRSRIQTVIDRRLYRRKYDAEKTLTAFAQTCRDEVDLDRLANALLHVVDETMQPEKIYLCLKPSNPIHTHFPSPGYPGDQHLAVSWPESETKEVFHV